jgi:protein-tyrosine phosphatase
VSARAPIRSILVVCSGNVCRSPFAEALLARSAAANGLPRKVTSAGFVSAGRQPPDHAVTASLEHEVDIRSHRSRFVTHAAVKTAELIVVMSAEQAMMLRLRFGRGAGPILVLGDLDPSFVGERTIRDPWRQSLSVFEESYARIERCIAELERCLAHDGATD